MLYDKFFGRVLWIFAGQTTFETTVQQSLAWSSVQANVGDSEICEHVFSCARSECLILCFVNNVRGLVVRDVHPNRTSNCQSGAIDGLYRIASLTVHACPWDSGR